MQTSVKTVILVTLYIYVLVLKCAVYLLYTVNIIVL